MEVRKRKFNDSDEERAFAAYCSEDEGEDGYNTDEEKKRWKRLAVLEQLEENEYHLNSKRDAALLRDPLMPALEDIECKSEETQENTEFDSVNLDVFSLKYMYHCSKRMSETFRGIVKDTEKVMEVEDKVSRMILWEQLKKDCDAIQLYFE
jgi:hypothetical protein